MEEEGSDLAAEIWQRASKVVSSVLCQPETRSALAAAQRSNRLTRAQHRRGVEHFEHLLAELTLIGVDAQLARDAGDLAEHDALRGYDATHLATALALGQDTLVVTWDRDLAGAALSHGLAVGPATG